MLRLVSNLFFKIVSRKTFFSFFESGVNELKIDRCLNSTNAHSTAKFYEEARVFNFQNDKTKISIGSNTHIRGELIIFPYGGKIQIGENCYVGEGSRIWSGENILIGDNVGIAHNINIVDFAHESNHLKRAEGIKNIFANGHPKEKGNILTSPIIIEDYVAIYANSSILRGVKIGKGSIISTGCVVMNDIPPFSLVMGNPARVMGKTN